MRILSLQVCSYNATRKTTTPPTPSKLSFLSEAFFAPRVDRPRHGAGAFLPPATNVFLLGPCPRRSVRPSVRPRPSVGSFLAVVRVASSAVDVGPSSEADDDDDRDGGGDDDDDDGDDAVRLDASSCLPIRRRRRRSSSRTTPASRSLRRRRSRQRRASSSSSLTRVPVLHPLRVRAARAVQRRRRRGSGSGAAGGTDSSSSSRRL